MKSKTKHTASTKTNGAQPETHTQTQNTIECITEIYMYSPRTHTQNKHSATNTTPNSKRNNIKQHTTTITNQQQKHNVYQKQDKQHTTHTQNKNHQYTIYVHIHKNNYR